MYYLYKAFISFRAKLIIPDVSVLWLTMVFKENALGDGPKIQK